jgi:hypothetical protein
MFNCCFQGRVPMIFGCPIVGSRLRELLGRLSRLRDLSERLRLPSVRHSSQLVKQSKTAGERFVTST